LTQSNRVRRPNKFQRFLRTFLGPFGYDPRGAETVLDDPGADGRETILRLSSRMEGDPALIAFAIPRFAALALEAPYELTRAQAVVALTTALDRQLPVLPPVAEPFREDAAAQRSMRRMLLGGDPDGDEPDFSPQDLAPARRTAVIRYLGETRYRTLKLASNALLTLGYLERFSGGGDRDTRRFVRDGIHRLARTVCRLTLERIQRTEKRDLVRGTAARALAAARQSWAEEMLLKMLLVETEASVLRKVYRSLDAYRTPRVARMLLDVLKSDPDPLRDALARRGLLNYTQQAMGPDPAAWEKRLGELGYLTGP
jgi:hypothetical protein